MKLNGINEAYFNASWSEGDMLQLQQLAVLIENETQGYTAISMVKELVTDTFDFIRTGNVFVFVGERTLTRTAYDKLVRFMDSIESLAARINQTALTRLVELIKQYVLFALISGSVILARGTATTHRFLMKYAVTTKDMGWSGQLREADPLVILIMMILEKSNASANVAAEYFGGNFAAISNRLRELRRQQSEEKSQTEYPNESFVMKALGAAAAGFVANHVKAAFIKPPKEEILDFGDEVVSTAMNQMAKEFIILAKKNPRKAAKFLHAVYKAAPEEYEKAFMDAMKAGVKKGVMTKVRSLFLSIGKGFLGR